ncbi:hypothetical protein EON80_26545, partial [bacterium]
MELVNLFLDGSKKWAVWTHQPYFRLTLARTAMQVENQPQSSINRIGLYEMENEAKAAVLRIAARLRAKASPFNAHLSSSPEETNMWIKAIDWHPFDKGFTQVEQLINLAHAHTIFVFKDRTKQWHVAVTHKGGTTSVALCESEVQAR